MKPSKAKRILSALPQILLAGAVLFIIAGTLVPMHLLYYPALLCLMLSGTVFLLSSSVRTGSRYGGILSIFNLLVCVIMAVQFAFLHFPVLSSTGRHLGAVILLFYAADISLYIHFFKGNVAVDKGTILPSAIFIAGPVLAAILFYCGVQAWIGLSAIVISYLVSVYALRGIDRLPILHQRP